MTKFNNYKYAVNSLPTYTCYTLFECPDKGNRSQTRNWNTLIQVISLRTQPFILQFPNFIVDDLSNYKFGSDYNGTAKIWSFTFEVEHPDLFEVNGDPIANLNLDSNLVPLLDQNNYIIPPKCLMTSGANCNIYYTFNSND